MSNFACSKNYYWLDAVEGDDGTLSLRARHMRKKDDKYLYWEKLGSDNSELYVSELEMFGVKIGGDKLQKLTEELWVRGIVVSRLGWCATYTDKMGNDHAHYRLYDIFNWSKYGFPIQGPKDEWKEFMSELPKYDKYEVNFSEFNSYDWSADANNSSNDESQVIKLNSDDLFISCRYVNGPILLWKVDSPSGAITIVRLVGQINCFQKAKLEINGFALQGKKLTTLRDEMLGRQVMVNRDGWCLFYTGDPTSNARKGRGGYYNKVLPRFPWYKYGIPTSNSFIWGSRDCYNVNQPQPLTEIMFPLSANGIIEGGKGDSDWEKKQKEKYSSGCETKEKVITCDPCGCEMRPKEKEELGSYKSKLEEKEIELCTCEARLKKKDRELEDCKLLLNEKETRLHQLEKRLNEKERELEDSEENLKKKEKEACFYKLQSKEREKEHEVSEKRLKEKDQEHSQSQSRLEDKEKELSSFKKLLKDKNQELSVCQLLLEEKEKELEVSKNHIQKKSQELSQCKLQLEENEKELSCFQKLLKDKDQELIDCKSELQDKEKELCSYKNQLAEMVNKFKDCELQKKAIEEELSLCSSRLDKAEKEICQKKNELKDLESQLQEKEKELGIYVKQQEEKDQKLKKMAKRLRDEQNRANALQGALDSLKDAKDCESEFELEVEVEEKTCL